MKINNLRGDLTNISAKKEALKGTGRNSNQTTFTHYLEPWLKRRDVVFLYVQSIQTDRRTDTHDFPKSRLMIDETHPFISSMISQYSYSHGFNYLITSKYSNALQTS